MNNSTEARKVIESCKGRTLAKAVASVNEWVNRSIGYIPPPPEWNFNRWKSPQRTLDEGVANCLDSAVLKMWMLIEAGYPAHDLRIGMLQKHAVLVFYYPHKRFCFSTPKEKEWVADINAPYFFRRESTSAFDNWRSDPVEWHEVQGFIAFDEETYFSRS